jgi:hypothetical protein
MDTVNLAADKFTDGMGARMTEFTINPANGTAEMRRVRLACVTFKFQGRACVTS